MGRNYLIWTLVFLLAVNLVSAAEIRGTITDENGNPLIGAFAFTNYNGVNIGAVADGNGNFVITGLGSGTYSVTFSYLNIEQNRLVNTDQDVNIQFGSIELPEVIIEAQRPSLFPVIEAKPFNPTGSDLDTIYGNSEFASEETIPIYPGNYLVLDGSKSQLHNLPLEEIYMTWYVGIPSSEFENLTENPDEFFYENLNTLLEDHKFFNPNYYIRRTSQVNIQLSREDFSSGDYYVVFKVTNPLDSFDEQFTWHKINIDVMNEDYCSMGGCEEGIVPDEQEDTDLEIIEIPAEERIITPFNPNDFPTTDQPQPLGTRAYNGRWVPLQFSAWSIQESDGFPGTPSYNSPLIPSTCSVGNQIKARDTCGCMVSGVFTIDCSRYTHVAEFSSSNDCESPIETIECPSGTLCALDSGAGACMTPHEGDLIEGESRIVALSQPEIRSNEVTITLTDNDLIDSAFCDSLGIDLSTLEVVESAPTASVIKQITGFFSKITGKQTAQRTYTATIATNKYSELARLEFPYLILGETRLRFLDLDVGTALLRDFGYDKNAITRAVSSSAPFYTEGDSKLVIRRSSVGYVITPSQILYDQVLTASRSKAVENLGSSSAVLATLTQLIDSRSSSNYLGLSFLLVQTSENKFFKIDGQIFSVSKGVYLVPYQPDYNVDYDLVLDPTQDNDLKTYYEVASKIPVKSFIIREGISIKVPILNPSEGYYLLRDIPSVEPKLETREISYTYKEEGEVRYRIIPIGVLDQGKDYGDYIYGPYLVPEKNIIVMDNEYLTPRNNRLKPSSSYNPPLPENKFSYNYAFFEEIRRMSLQNSVFGNLFDFLEAIFYRNIYRNVDVRMGN